VFTINHKNVAWGGGTGSANSFTVFLENFKASGEESEGIVAYQGIKDVIHDVIF